MKRDEYDLIVVGSGVAGLSAACTAAARGARVAVLEASKKVGGTSALSGGMLWVPANYKMKSAGLPDDVDSAKAYLSSFISNAGEDRRLAAFLDRGDEAIQFLEVHTSLRLRPVKRYPDYYPNRPGATAGGRVLEPEEFDGTELGSDFILLRDPMPEFLLFGGMMVSRADLPILRRVGRSIGASWHAVKLLLAYAFQRSRSHRGTTLVLGNALVARLFKSARDLGVEIHTQSPVARLNKTGDRIVGVTANRAGELLEMSARLGVVLATGGLSSHPVLRRNYVPKAAGDLSAAFDAKCESGAQLALDVGAALSAPTDSLETALAFWVPVSRFKRSDGTAGVFPHTVTDRAKPGIIAVNRDGHRFVNEAVSYHEFVRAQLRDPERNIPAWLICDAKFLWKYGLGRVRPFALSVSTELKSGYLKRAATPEALARILGLSEVNLLTTLRNFNAGARRGEDPEFGRGSDIYQQHLGDAENLPNFCVAAIEHPPFYAVAVEPADLGVAAGVLTDSEACVVAANGERITGLYACGNDMESIMRGAYPGPGITLGPALVFGYIAASHACALASNRNDSPYMASQMH